MWMASSASFSDTRTWKYEFLAFLFCLFASLSLLSLSSSPSFAAITDYFANTKTLFFGFPTSTEDQQLYRNCSGLCHRLGQLRYPASQTQQLPDSQPL